MPQYRIYLHDEFGRFRGVEDLDCADDRQAIATARQRAGAEEMELWDRGRFVTRIGRSGPVRPIAAGGELHLY
jgi:hypothetical protein